MNHLKISTHRQEMDQDFICCEIQNSYWAKGRDRRKILRSLRHSLCFGLFLRNKQIGFARVISDYATYAYLCDVLVAEKYRGRGYGTFLLKRIFDDRRLRTVKWSLRTKDAHGLYEKFGFARTNVPERYMDRPYLEAGIPAKNWGGEIKW